MKRYIGCNTDYVLNFNVYITCKECKYYNNEKAYCNYYNMLSKSYQYCKAGQLYGRITEAKKVCTRECTEVCE